MQGLTDTRTDFSLERLDRLWNLSHPLVVWRHDVDYDLASAVQMAEREAEHGIRATYYLRALPDDYDPQTPEFVDAARQIVKYRHRLGTHVDLCRPRDDYLTGTEMQVCCAVQSRALRKLGLDVGKRVSLHAPPRTSLFRAIPNFDNAMTEEWEGSYVADSRGSFRFGIPEYMLCEGLKLQVNLHPEWWFLPPDEADTLREREMGNP